ncbi:dTDP-4-dehydrorhamnose reductase [Paenibacillus sp. SC116]|uniref:dTDP-4-dehydrorhamnose reductase n=1 Tax=Paenibacillus sp. SC116 TaxID=2968986 RepID=UPI00215AB980|nr:dTDP-4-dehydrorhamnose reductase [Paenibacillus sp. SC116]MCR8844854.1 dTDP-4-dehydrorhamnose reductase [Paenibacillus sp. SC116]
MKVLVTGADGQLGQDVVQLFRNHGHEVVACNRSKLDITKQSQCQQVIREEHPAAIIHCAAYTAVDQAETDVDRAYEVNAVGTRNVAVAAESIGAKLIYISTDYVFNGRGNQPYNEYDNTDPQGIYGKSKRAGEVLIQSLSSRFFIVRTSWVFGEQGANFVKTMMKLGVERDQLKVVHDQVGSPTYTVDLAQFLLQLVETEQYGIYHASNSGICSWYEFAEEIFKQCSISAELLPCTTEEFPRPAPRPQYSVMEPLSIRTNGFELLPHWKDALARYIAGSTN